MATYSSSLRSGVPRVEGGDPWPPEGTIGEPLEPGATFEPGTADEIEESAASGAESQSPVADAVPESVSGGEAESFDEVASVEDSDTVDDADSADDVEESATQASDGAPAAAAAEVPLRRGLPRVAGGNSWPPEGFAPAGAKAVALTRASSAPPVADAPATSTVADPADSGADVRSDASFEPQAESETADDTSGESSSAAPVASGVSAVTGAVAGVAAAAAVSGSDGDSSGISDVPLRRGLPRVSGGDPWPPEGFASVAAVKSSTAESEAQEAPASSSDAEVTSAESTNSDSAATDDSTASAPAGEKPQRRRSGIGAAGAAAGAGAAASAASGPAQGDRAKDASAQEEPAAKTAAEPAQRKPMGAPAAKSTDKPAQRKPMAKPADKPAGLAAEKPAAKTADEPAAKTPSSPSTTATSSGSAAKTAEPKKEPIMIGSRSLGQWAKLGGGWFAAVVVAAGIIILAARGVTTLPGVPEFLERYPGEYHLPEFVDDGFPAWVRWTHFLNIFFMVLIIRSGLQVRHQQKPPAFYTPKKGGKKISINLWLHTSLDLLWLANGVVFIVLLFVSGHWARIVPTSWEVFPNAISSMLQYMTLEWPAENGWVNYNSLQQLLYFIVVFIAAPLAAISGVRMSEWWPKDATKLNKIYPAPLARAIHFPTMIFFVVFILIHVFLVFATGMRQNLNHMFAGTDALNWVGFIWFVVSLAVIVGGWFAARPLLLAPIANLFGRVSSR